MPSADRKPTSADYLTCPDLGHRWTVVEFERETQGRFHGRIKRLLQCEGCGTTRTDYLGWGGEVVGRRYIYDDYRDRLALFGDRHDRVQRVRAVLLSARFEAPKVTRRKAG